MADTELSTAPTVAAPEAAPASASPAAEASPQQQLEADFAEKAKAGVDSWLKRVRGPESAPAEKTADGETPLPDTVTQKTAPIPEPVKTEEPVAQTPAEPEKAPEPAPEEAKTTVPDAYRLNVRGQESEYSRAEVEQVIDFAIRANEKLTELQAWEEKLTSRSNDPDMKLVELLKNNEEIRGKFMALLEENDPSAATHHSLETQASELERLKSEIAMLKEGQAKREETIQKKMAERQAALEAKERETKVKAYTDQINATILPEAEKSGISQEIVDDIGWRYYRHCRANNITPTVESTVNYYRTAFNKVVAEREAYRNSARSGYLQEKAKAPLAPPTGGATPQIQTPAPKTMKEAKNAALQYMQAMMAPQR